MQARFLFEECIEIIQCYEETLKAIHTGFPNSFRKLSLFSMNFMEHYLPIYNDIYTVS